MGHIHRRLPSPGTKIGLAFSGGLDTRTATAWLTEQGLAVHAYVGDLGQPDVERPEELLAVARQHGAAQARLVDAKEALAAEAIVALQCGAFHIATAGRYYFNTTPLGRAVTASAIVRAMQEDGVHVFSDGSTYKGNDIQRFYRYGLLVDPTLEIYKPWLDSAFVEALGGRAEMSAYLERRGLPYSRSAEQAYSTDANLLGATHEAKALEGLEVGAHLVDPLMGVAFWRPEVSIPTERVLLRFDRGVPVALDDQRYPSPLALLQRANQIAGRHGLGMSDQIENRVIGAKSRGIYEAPGMALLFIGYERLVSATHNDATIELHETFGRRLGRLLYAGQWYDPEALLLKRASQSVVAPAVSGEVVLELRRGDDYSILETRPVSTAYAPEKLSMERVQGAFTAEDRIGMLEMQALSIHDNRALLQLLAEASS